MARLTRKLLKVFALNATNNGVFGSAQDGTKVITNNILTLQGKPAWLTGWLDAIIGTKKFPAVEEFQSVQYVHSYQTAYLLQEGIPEYDSTTTYYLNSIVKKPGTYEIYGSKIDSNTGNALPVAVSDSNWQYLQDLSSSVAQATETVKGIAEIATAAEVATGTDDERIVTPLKLRPYRFSTGDGKDRWLSTLEAGWIWADGKTIGDASSNATNRANADCEDLFKALWAETDYAYSGSVANELLGQLQVKDSSGNNVARGASAAADWAAHRQIAVIDKRGRASFGKDNMGGTPAGRLTGQPGGIDGTKLGGAGGGESTTLSTTNLPAHTHDSGTLAAASAGTHNHQFSTNQGSGSAPPNTTPGQGGSTLSSTVTVSSAGAHTHTISGDTGSVGSGTAFNNLPPGKTCNYVLKL